MAASDWDSGLHVYDEISLWMSGVAVVAVAMGFYREPAGFVAIALFVTPIVARLPRTLERFRHHGEVLSSRFRVRKVAQGVEIRPAVLRWQIITVTLLVQTLVVAGWAAYGATVRVGALAFGIPLVLLFLVPLVLILTGAWGTGTMLLTPEGISQRMGLTRTVARWDDIAEVGWYPTVDRWTSGKIRWLDGPTRTAVLEAVPPRTFTVEGPALDPCRPRSGPQRAYLHSGWIDEPGDLIADIIEPIRADEDLRAPLSSASGMERVKRIITDAGGRLRT